MEEVDGAVGRSVHIRFQMGDSQIYGALESNQRIFFIPGAYPAVREGVGHFSSFSMIWATPSSAKAGARKRAEASAAGCPEAIA